MSEISPSPDRPFNSGPEQPPTPPQRIHEIECSTLERTVPAAPAELSDSPFTAPAKRGHGPKSTPVEQPPAPAANTEPPQDSPVTPPPETTVPQGPGPEPTATPQESAAQATQAEETPAESEQLAGMTEVVAPVEEKIDADEISHGDILPAEIPQLGIAVAAALKHGGQQLEIHTRYDSFVVAADKELRVKAPRDDSSERARPITNEHAALAILEDAPEPPPVAIPQIIDYSEEPLYLATTYIPGNVVTERELNMLNPATRYKIGQDLGHAIVWQATADPQEVQNSFPAISNAWGDSFQQHIVEFSNESYPTLSELTHTLGEKWMNYLSRLGNASLQLINADLIPSNMCFTDDFQLSGIFDWGAATRGDTAQEVSAILSGNETHDPLQNDVVRGCMDTLDAAGIAPDPADVSLWRQLKDLYVLPFWIARGNTSHPFFLALKQTVMRRYPHLDWRELK